MAPSPFYARIRNDVLAISASVPHGRVTTFSEIGQWLDVMPRHVAYILAQLDGDEQGVTPWHRVVAEGGKVAAGKTNQFNISQQALLEEEGIAFGRDATILAFEAVFCPVDALAHGVPRQKRPADAPVARTPRKAKRR